MIRIALKMLLGDWGKSMGVAMGVFLSTFLVAHLLAMFTGMMQRTFSLITDVPQPDIWVMDPAVEYVDDPAPLSATALDRVRSIEGVAWAMPLYAGSLRARLPSGAFRTVHVIGVDDATLVGLPDDIVQGSIDALRGADAMIVDEESARERLRLPIAPIQRIPGEMPSLSRDQTRPLRVGDDLLINDHRVRIVGIARLSPRFLTRSTLYTTLSHARSIAPPERNLLSFVLVKAQPGLEHADLARSIEARTGLRARTRREFEIDTLRYVVRETGVVGRLAFIVGVGVLVGFAVTALLLFLFTIENLPIYATFKALGAPNRMILRMIVAQAALCGLVGFGLGVGASAIVGRITPQATMPYLLLWQVLSFTAAAMFLICTISAVLSARIAWRVDPARVFK